MNLQSNEHQKLLQLKVHLLSKQAVPVVFKNKLRVWKNLPSTPADLVTKCGDVMLDFRIVPRCHKGLTWEGMSQFIEATIQEFYAWQYKDGVDPTNPFSEFSKKEFWAYSSYNHMAFTFPENSVFRKEVNWSAMGFPEETGDKGTFWLGSEGSYTPCHYDTYGCNLVAQILGRKKWVLFSPDDNSSLYPTRIPYEESSVFSSVNIGDPDLAQHPHFQNSHPHVVVLEPGDILFVPKKWWHFVTCLEDFTLSINNWIDSNTDSNSQLEEGICRTLMTCLIPSLEPEGKTWLNPKEELTSPETSMGYIISHLKSLKRQGSSSSSVGETTQDYAKVRKISVESDVHSNPLHAFSLEHFFTPEEFKEIKATPFFEFYGHVSMTPALTNNSQEPSAEDVVNCFVHPDVIDVICGLLKDI